MAGSLQTLLVFNVYSKAACALFMINVFSYFHCESLPWIATSKRPIANTPHIVCAICSLEVDAFFPTSDRIDLILDHTQLHLLTYQDRFHNLANDYLSIIICDKAMRLVSCYYFTTADLNILLSTSKLFTHY